MAVAPTVPTPPGATPFLRSPGPRRRATPLRASLVMAFAVLWTLPEAGMARPLEEAPVEAAMSWPLLPTGVPLAPHAPPRTPRPVLASPSPQEFQVDRVRGTITLIAQATPSAFRGSSDPDDRYHALVSRTGGAMAKSLMVTDANDRLIAEALRSLGAEDGGGVPMAAWNRRAIPFVPGPGARVAGARVEIFVTWEGADRTYTLGELLADPAPGEVEIRFGGNEEHDHHWPSGCIICLYSCPGGVLSNALKTIRDHSRGHSFAPDDTFPPDGTLLTVTLQILPA